MPLENATGFIVPSRECDGVYRPDKKTFKDAYKIVDIPELPSKTKESAFEVLNRTIWTNNKAFKSGMIDSGKNSALPSNLQYKQW